MVRTRTTVALLAGALVATGALTGCTATARATGSVPAASPAAHEQAPDGTPASVTGSSTAGSPAPLANSANRVTAPGSASAALATLSVKGRGPKTGYSRARFGAAWADVNRNGCDTRNDVLRRDLTSVRLTAGTGDCRVAAGTLADPYSGTTIAFTRGVTTSSEVRFDHVVALSNAWQTGALTWTADQREALANDPLNPLAVQGRLNEQKGDGDAATWLPPNKAVRCAYVSRQVAVKARYGLWVTPPEKAAITRLLVGCPGQSLPGESTAPSGAALTPSVPEETRTSTAVPSAGSPAQTAPVSGSTPRSGVYYSSCAAVRRAGKAPLGEGQPGYRAKLDGDHNGVACQDIGPQPRITGLDPGDIYHPSCSAVRNAGKAPLNRGQPGYRAELDGDHNGVACQ